MHSKTLNRFKILLAVFAAAWLTGCASVQHYSIESYQGPFPINDRHFIYETE